VNNAPVRVLMLDGGDRTPYLSRLVAHLARDGLEMHYAADARYKDFGMLEAAGVTCHSIQVRSKLDFRARHRIHRILKRQRIDILHTIAGRDAYVGLRARGRKPIPVFVRRGAYAPISKFDFTDFVVYGKRGAWRFIVVSTDLVEHMARQGVARERLVNVYTGIWSPELEPQRRDLRAEYGIGPDALLLAHVGNARPVKGFPYLLAALADLKRRGVVFHLLVAGKGYEDEVAAIDRLGLTDAITLLGHVDVMQITPNVDIMVLPSRIDAAPRAVIEATVVGTPVVGTRVGGVPEILDDGRGGVLVDPGDPSSMAKALADAARDPESMRALAQHALRRNRELFSIEHCAARHRELYDDAMKRA